jgi:hypothetical protein
MFITKVMTIKYIVLEQAIENTFAVANKVPMDDCVCEPAGSFRNNSIEQLKQYAEYNKVDCEVSSLFLIKK